MPVEIIYHNDPNDPLYGQTTTINHIDPPGPIQHTPGNPYFGKKPLETKDFYALAGTTLGARFVRLYTDPAFLWVRCVIDKCDVIDPDDQSGQFLQVLAYLQATNASDGQPLMSAQDVAGIMGAWR